MASVPTALAPVNRPGASTRRGQLAPVRASSESSLRRRKPTELVSGFGGRRSRLGSTGQVTLRPLTPRFRPRATAATRTTITRLVRAVRMIKIMLPAMHRGGGAATQTAHDVRARCLMRAPTTSRVAARRVPVDGASERRRESVL